MREIVAAVERVTGREVVRQEAPRRPGDPAVLYASAARARQDLGWLPARPDIETIVGDAWQMVQEAARPAAARAVTAFLRLLEFARPYRGRLAAAVAAMIVYGIASAGIAYLIKPIFDEVLPTGRSLGRIASLILGLYFCKGVGAYLSAYLMTGVGQRVVRDLRNVLFRHILRQSAAFFSSQTTGRLMSRITNDVAQIQSAVSETVGDLMRESLSIVGYAALLLYIDTRLAVLCLTGAPMVVYPLVRLGQSVRRTTRRSQEALEHMSHVSAEAFSGHRIVKAFGAEAREASKFEAAARHLYRTNMRVTSALSVLPPLMEFMGGLAFVGALWFGSQEIAVGPAHARRLRHLRRGAVHDVRAGEEVEPGQRQHPAGARRVGAHLRHPRHAQRGRRPARRAAGRAVPPRHRVPRRPVHLRRGRRRHARRRERDGAGGPDAGHRRAQRRRQDDAGQPAAAVLRRHRRRASCSTASTSAA